MENKTYTSTPNLYFSPPIMSSPHETLWLTTLFSLPFSFTNAMNILAQMIPECDHPSLLFKPNSQQATDTLPTKIHPNVHQLVWASKHPV